VKNKNMETSKVPASNSAITSAIVQLEKKYPNNMEFGSQVRKLLMENQKSFQSILSKIMENKKG
jgi:hypothetical protein